MSAESATLPPRYPNADDTVRRTIQALAAARGTTKDQLADAIGLSRSAMFGKLRSRGAVRAFTAGEVAALANFFGVAVEDLYDGLGGRLAGSQSSLGTVKSRYRSFVPVVAGSVTKITVDYPDNVHDLLPRIERRRVERRVSDRRMTA